MTFADDHFTMLISGKAAFAAAALVTLWVLESVWPMFIGRRERTRHAAANLALGVFNAVIVSLLFGAAILLVTEWARQRPFGLLHWLDAPAWLAWPLGLLLFDAWMYTWHVLNHHVPFLWRFHAVHHADRQLDVTSAVRFHTIEIMLSATARLMVLPFIGLTLPMLLAYELILLPVIMFHHSNIRIPPRVDSILRWLIVTPRMHWVHHSCERHETNSNFASVLSIWDRLFRTFRLRSDPEAIVLGLDDQRDESDVGSWRSLRGMLARPFRQQPPRDRRPEGD